MTGRTFFDGDTQARAERARREVAERTAKGWDESHDPARIAAHVANLKLLLRIEEEHLANVRGGDTRWVVSRR